MRSCSRETGALVLNQDEIRSALDDLDASANRVRHMLISDARRIFPRAGRARGLRGDAYITAARQQPRPLQGVLWAGWTAAGNAAESAHY
jgi:hypothetical protein